MSRERNDLIASGIKKWISTRNQAANSLLGKTREGSVYDSDLYSDRVCCFFDILQLCD